MSHPLLQSFRAATPAFGAWLALPSAHTARQVALAGRPLGLSWVCIDCEHGLTPLVPGAADAVAALPPVPGGPSVLVRVPHKRGIARALDAGAHGVVVPMIAAASDARAAVRAARFPPHGNRGAGSPFAHQAWPGADAAAYLAQRANEEVVVCVQIETRGAVHMLDQIAATKGVDVLFVGPYDLSLALGYPVPHEGLRPAVEEAVQRVKDAAHAHGKKAAYYCTSGAEARARVAEGFDMVTVQSDVGALAAGLRRALADAGARLPAGDDTA